MEKQIKGIKKFFEEFKKFITRGNVLDMSVGVIVGGAFTSIVNGLTNFILKPVINWLIALIIGTDGLEGAITMLSPAYVDKLNAAGEVIGKELDLAASIYIDWGSFISAIINFLLIAFVLFVVVRAINNFNAAREKAIADMGVDYNEKKAVRKIQKQERISYEAAKSIYDAQVKAAKEKAQAEADAAARAAAEEARIAEEKAMVNTKLLEEIRDLLKNK